MDLVSYVSIVNMYEKKRKEFSDIFFSKYDHFAVV